MHLGAMPRTLIGAAIALGLLALVVHAFLGSSSVRQPYVQPVTLTPPPPPPAPPPEPKRVEEPVQTQRFIRDDTTETSGPVTEGPPGPPGPPGAAGLPATGPLGFNEAGEAGGDVFGLAARRGGHELLMTAPRGGGGGDRNARFFQYADALRSYVQLQLNSVDELRRACYSLEVTIRVGADGRMEDVRIHHSTGDPALDARIRGALVGLKASDPPPPSDMPWPVGLRIVSRREDCGGAAGSN